MTELITLPRALVRQALEALENSRASKLEDDSIDWMQVRYAAITALKAALAEEALQRLTDANQEIEAPLEQPEQGGKTGWPPGLLQDDCRGLSKWLASQPDARRRVREAVSALEQPEQEPDRWGAGYEAGYAAGMAEMKPEQEPVAWIQSNHLQLAQRGPFSCRVEPTQRHPDFVPLFTHPPRREWRSLSEEEIKNAVGASAEFWATSALWIKSVACAIEAALRSKNYE